MKKYFFFRLFAGYIFIIFALTGLTLFVIWPSIEDHFTWTVKNALRNSALMAKPAILPLLQTNRVVDLDKTTKTVGMETQTRITVIDAEGRVLADSEQDARTMENHKNRPEFAEALEGNMGSARRFSSTANQDMLYVAVPIQGNNNQIIGAIRTSFSLRSINNLLANLRANMLRIALFIALFALVAAAVLSRAVSRPIHELTQAVRKVSSGDFGVRVYPRSGGEIRELSDSFNAMSDEIEAMVLQLKSQKEELDNIIASLREGLLVMNLQGQITMANESFRRIVGGAGLQGRSYWQVLRNTPFIELIEKVQEEKAGYTEELELDERVFICNATYLPLRQEVVAVFHDITDIRNVERVKRDFVVNVSHELRTPLTAIKGFTETLEEDAAPEARHYLEIIKRNTDRLINIISDLLLLSRLEEKGMQLELQEVNLRDLIQNIAKVFEPSIREKDLKLSIAIDKTLPLISGDVFKLEQLFINLFDNAIKYTEAGEVHVDAHTGDSRSVVVEVKDTGIGIPSEDIPRIFERFYVVDKSRSKKVGGTGLGLSIVKHIVLLHNGTIDVISTQGVGTTVRVVLPINPERAQL